MRGGIIAGSLAALAVLAGGCKQGQEPPVGESTAQEKAGEAQKKAEQAEKKAEQAQQETEPAYGRAEAPQPQAQTPQQAVAAAQREVAQKQRELAEAHERLARAQAEAVQAQPAGPGAPPQAQPSPQQPAQPPGSQPQAPQALRPVPGPAPQAQPRAPWVETVQGRVVRATPNEIVVARENAPELTVKIDARTSTALAGQPSAPSALAPGMEVRVSYRMEAGQPVAEWIEGAALERQPVRGVEEPPPPQ